MNTLRWVLPDRLFLPRAQARELNESRVRAGLHLGAAALACAALSAVLDRHWQGAYASTPVMVVAILRSGLVGAALFLLYGTTIHGLLGWLGGKGRSLLSALGYSGYALTPLFWVAAVWFLLALTWNHGAPLSLSILLHDLWWVTVILLGSGAAWSFWLLVEGLSEIHGLAPRMTAQVTVYTLALLTLGLLYVILPLTGTPIPESMRGD